jgi:hypothetical protein
MLYGTLRFKSTSSSFSPIGSPLVAPKKVSSPIPACFILALTSPPEAPEKVKDLFTNPV